MDNFKVPVLPTPVPKSEAPAVEESADPKTEIQPPPRKLAPATACPYSVPKWSAPPKEIYKFEVLKSGQIIDEVKELQQQATWTFGRLPDNDVEMAHPTISRYHAVLQFKPKATAADTAEKDDSETKIDQPEGWYVYDLGSTHGTFLNKQRLPPRVYIRMRVGHMLKLGSSTRAYILQGPTEDEEPESELTVTELREQREQQVAAAAAEKQRKALEAEERERNEGASWGMGEDADEETDLTHNPFASTNNEELFFDDPKRTLRGYFEREGLQLEYKCDEISQGSFVCRVELPLDDLNGRPIVVEAVHKGRKKDCVAQCALDACRTLDRHGVLRQANQEAHKRKQAKSGDSDDDDEFWDRTGDVARKKQRKATAGTSVTLTYDDLLKQESALNAELQQVEQEISNYQLQEKRLKAVAAQQSQQSAGDDLDNFMDTLSGNVTQVDKTEIKKLRLEEQRIKGEQLKLQRLIKIAKPTDLPFAAASGSIDTKSQTPDAGGAKRQLPMIGKRNQFSKFKVVKPLPSTRAKAETKAFASDEEEVEEEEATSVAEVVEKPSTATQLPVEAETIKATDAATGAEVVVPIAAGEAAVSTPEPATRMATAVAAIEAEENVGEQTEEEAAAHKKRRQRARQRNKQRHDVDMDELVEHEDTDKYAKWVPPSNQSGDGITHLNQKFGY